MRIDLHTHSTGSDGTQPPAEVVAAAVEAGLDVVALTDHDSTAGWEEAAEAAQRLGVALVPGAEISCQWRGVSVHLLSYLHDPEHPRLLAELTRARSSRERRAARMVELIGVDYPLTWDDVATLAAPGATLGRPHIADALVARGHAATRDEAFTSILVPGSRYYVPHYAPDPLVAVELVRAAGGVPVFAHPKASRRGYTVDDHVIEVLVEGGLAGLEVDHRDHSERDRRRLREIAAGHDLIVTGSSDYHGTGKQNLLGENTTEPAMFERIEAEGTGQVVRP